MKHRLYKNAIASLIVTLGLTVGACANLNSSPVKNSRPKDFLDISGHIAPALHHYVSFRIIQTYVSTNPRCAKTTNTIEGIKEPPSFSTTYPAQPNASGTYHIRIPLDAFIPGPCHWKATNAGYTLTNREYTDQPRGYALFNFDRQYALPMQSINFDPKHLFSTKTASHNPPLYTFLCNKQATACKSHLSKGESAIIYLQPNHSHHQIININLQK